MSDKKNRKTVETNTKKSFNRIKNLSDLKQDNKSVQKEKPSVLSHDDLAFMISNLEKRMEIYESIFSEEIRGKTLKYFPKRKGVST